MSAKAPIEEITPGAIGIENQPKGVIRLLWLAGALLSDTAALKASTGDPDAEIFYTNQEDCFLQDDHFQATQKSRQIGESWAFAVDSLARAVSEPFTTNVHISTDQWESESKHGYVERTIDALPNAYKSHFKVKSNSKRHMEIETIKGVSNIDFLAQRAPRGAERTSVYLHEMAFMAKLEEILKAARYSIAHGGFIKGCSTHEGSASTFNQIVTNAVTENGQKPYRAWKCGYYPWWSCPAFCIDVERALKEAPHLDTDARVAKFGTEILKALRDGSTYDDFREEMECLVIDSKYSYFPTELIERCQVQIPPEGDYWFKKAEYDSRHVGAMLDAEKLISELGKEISEGRLNGRWYWAMDIGKTNDPDAICIGHTLREDPETVALRMVLTFKGIDFPSKERIVRHLLKTLPIEAGLIDQTGLGTQMGEWGEREFKRKAMGFTFTNASKSDIVNALKVRMERNGKTGCARLMIPFWQTLRKQINSIRQSSTPSGKMTYDADRDDKGHADIFFALAMMNSLVALPAGNRAFVPIVVNQQQGQSDYQQRGGIWVPGGLS